LTEKPDLASMRPRLFAAENVDMPLPAAALTDASMRPRLFAAENSGAKGPA